MSIISSDISKAVALLASESLVAIPTETVYGLAGNIYSDRAISLIFETKKRPAFNPLIVHIPSKAMLPKIVKHVPEKAQLLADAFWPGPLTLVLKKQDSMPDRVTAGKDTVAVRIPNHPITLELLSQLDFPVAAPSANPFGSISPTTAEHVEGYFKDDIKMVLQGGACQKGIESTIIGFNGETPILYRLGSIAVEAIEAVVGSIEIANKKEKQPDAPGQLSRHYAPSTKTILVDDINTAIDQHQGKNIGVLSFAQQPNNALITYHLQLSKVKDLEEATRKLYAALHKLDHHNLDIIIAERLPQYGLGISLNDRLERATKS